jgi:hypothetical protein
MKRLLINIKTSIFKGKSKTRSLLLMILLIILSVSPVFSSAFFQDQKPLKTKLSLSCTQMPNHQIEIQAKIRAKIEKKYVAIPDIEVEIYNLTDSIKILLKKGVSDKEGLFVIKINAKYQLQLREDGYYSIMVSFSGDEKHKSSKKELLFKPAILELNTTELDSVKMIAIKLIEENDDAQPIGDVEVILQIPRLFSNLTIASEYTDEDGMVEFEFPNDLPGGESGELLIIAKAEDTDDYASLQNQIQLDWGIPTSAFNHQESRSLWSPDAPLWMVFTFAILMTLVWGHFLIIIYKLNLIRREGKLLADESF